METTFPKATRQLEYIAFFNFEVRTMEGPGFVFMAVDAFSGYAIGLETERDAKPETILKNIYFLLEHPEVAGGIRKGFTLVLDDHKELSDRIHAILEPAGGKVLFDK